jgi:hypothetical protein
MSRMAWIRASIAGSIVSRILAINAPFFESVICKPYSLRIFIAKKIRFSAMENESRRKNPKKNRCMDAATQQSENFAMQNSRQESTNPRMDLWFHVFGNAKQKLSEKSKKKFSASSTFVVVLVWMWSETKLNFFLPPVCAAFKNIFIRSPKRF